CESCPSSGAGLPSTLAQVGDDILEGGICGTCIYVKAKLKVLGLANDTIIKCEECSEDLCNIKKFTSRTGASSVLTLAAGLAVLITVPWLTPHSLSACRYAGGQASGIPGRTNRHPEGRVPAKQLLHAALTAGSGGQVQAGVAGRVGSQEVQPHRHRVSCQHQSQILRPSERAGPSQGCPAEQGIRPAQRIGSVMEQQAQQLQPLSGQLSHLRFAATVGQSCRNQQGCQAIDRINQAVSWSAAHRDNRMPTCSKVASSNPS
uniref:Variant-specific surface protein n=1 Tax=Macrostomum lignano TaxID=282301 RepID=A0A1I8IX11_9PLAT